MIFLFLTHEEAEEILAPGNIGISLALHKRISDIVIEDNKIPSGDDPAPLMVAYRYGVKEVAVVYEDLAHADKAWKAIRDAARETPRPADEQIVRMPGSTLLEYLRDHPQADPQPHPPASLLTSSDAPESPTTAGSSPSAPATASASEPPACPASAPPGHTRPA